MLYAVHYARHHALIYTCQLTPVCSAPSNPTVLAAWLEALSMAEFQGCGHIRLMIASPSSALYSVALRGTNVTVCPANSNPANCISSSAVATEVIRQWYRCAPASRCQSSWLAAPRVPVQDGHHAQNLARNAPCQTADLSFSSLDSPCTLSKFPMHLI